MTPSGSLDVGFVFLDYLDHNLYQLRQWIQPLERLQENFSVSVFCTSPDAQKALHGSSLSSVSFEGQDQLTEQLYKHRPKVLLYANQNVRNFYALRFPEAVHVFVSHGESDKAYMSQNTIKRYDLYFAAGQAAVDRISASVSAYDVTKRIFQIGRPQVNDFHGLPQNFKTSSKKRVLYAPTWEGVTRATRYTSIASHGLRLVENLLATGKYQITYRPHPLSGSRDQEVKAANDAIKRLINQANKSNSSDIHYFDESPFGWQLGYHELMISDISAIAYDWLSTGHPILLTKPVEKRAVAEDFPLVDKLQSISVGGLGSIAETVEALFENSGAQQDVATELNGLYFKQPIAASDEHFTEAIVRAVAVYHEQIGPANFPSLKSYKSRGRALGLLRYPNFLIREVLRLTGIWSLSKQLETLTPTDEIYLHLSDPFNRKSLVPSITEIFKHHKAGTQLVLILNQVTSLLEINKILRREEFVEVSRDVLLIPVANAADCELVVAKLKPRVVKYLKHHPLNHMMLRLNGMEHVLWKPDSDPFFEADHSMITYDRVHKPSPETIGYLQKLISSSRPVITNEDIR